jgi:hypothetical protein
MLRFPRSGAVGRIQLRQMRTRYDLPASSSADGDSTGTVAVMMVRPTVE